MKWGKWLGCSTGFGFRLCVQILQLFDYFVLLVRLDYHRTSTPLVGYYLSLPLKIGNADIVRPRFDVNCLSLSVPKAFVKLSTT